MANNKNVCLIVIVVVGAVAVMTIALVATSLKKLASDQVGVKYDTIQKTLADSVETEGLHNGPPGFEFIIFPNTYSTMTFENLRCLNKDGVIINLNVAYQYRAENNKLRGIILDFRDFDNYKRVLRYAGASALHDACSQFNTSQFQSERGRFQEVVRSNIRQKYADLSCLITDLQVSNIARPSAYESAIRSKERAREDIQVALRERPRLLTEAETELREAETQSQIIIDKAMSDARIMESRAQAEASAIKTQYAKEAEAYKAILSSSGLGLTVEGFISYLGTRVISSAKNPVYIGMQSPAKASYLHN